MSGKGGKPDAWDCCRSWLNMVWRRSSQSNSSREQGGVCEPHHGLQRSWEVMLAREGGPVFFRGVVPVHDPIPLCLLAGLVVLSGWDVEVGSGVNMIKIHCVHI